MVNVHAAGGPAMMTAAAQAVAAFPPGAPLVIAVTVLTSLSDLRLSRTRLAPPRTVPQQVEHLARATKAAGLDGVVASHRDPCLIRQACGPGFLIVTPGVRPADAARNDQQRVMTPGQAIRAGADYLVVGRPIQAATDPVEAARTHQCGMPEPNPTATATW